MFCQTSRGRVACIAALLAGLVALTGTAKAQPGNPVATAETTVEGSVEVQYADYPDGARLRHYLRTNDRLLELQFRGTPPDITTGARVRVRGSLQGNNTLLLSSDSGATQVVALANPNTFGVQKTLVILVNYADKVTQPYTVATAQSMTFNTVNNYYLENTYQQTSLSGTVIGWFTIGMSSTTCDESGATVASLANQAALNAGVDLSQYNHIVYAFPQNACTWLGMGTLGGTPSKAWINGSYTLRVVAHELGHNLGDYHSHSVPCDSSTCTTVEYGDDRDIMGKSGVVGHMNAFQKERLGWLNYGISPPIQTVTATNNYWIEPMSSNPGGNAKALKVLKSTDASGKRTWYYIETRAKIGQDSNLTPGVVIHTGSESSGNTSSQLDLQPTTSTWDSTLDPGQSFSDPALGLTITTLTADNSGALVQVAFGPLPCTTLAPSLALSPASNVWMQPGTTARYSLTLTNNDTSGCPAAPFALQAALPSGWSTSLAPSVTVAPAASTTLSFDVTSPGTASGAASFSVSAGEPGGATASASGSLTIVSGIAVSTSTDKASYGTNATVSMSANVSANQSGVAGATVTFLVTTPTGATSKVTATTDAAGNAKASYKLKGKVATGSYRMDATASLSGMTGSGTTTFTVQ